MKYKQGDHIVLSNGIHGVVKVIRRHSKKVTYQIEREDWHGRIWVKGAEVVGIYKPKQKKNGN